MNTIRCIAALGLLVWAASATANEPLWTDQVRLQKQDFVCTGTVISVQKLGPVDAFGDLYLAVLEISGIMKGERTAPGSKVNICYEFSTSGVRSPRSEDITN